MKPRFLSELDFLEKVEGKSGERERRRLGLKFGGGQTEVVINGDVFVGLTLKNKLDVARVGDGKKKNADGLGPHRVVAGSEPSDDVLNV